MALPSTLFSSHKDRLSEPVLLDMNKAFSHRRLNF
jgi:hypothetical protein